MLRATSHKSGEAWPLSKEDITLLSLLARGLPIDSVAREMDVSERTVRRKSRAICERLGVPAPISAVCWAAQRGLL
ncbi:LuxR C-terminal-related transcriptional regulator [Acrocarpospora catenulata]|uniref:LuxR C-terminal-related transcriptional regulator n=1 Tax=Acrocarpospora catenulata TaxID=2836182 RepID=UPI001BD9EF18|nr:LuxR C-terminal-related transcriptional regulator [Acrocarpospora catenulata]